ncbi:hypothetical protein N0V82_010629 [Gnomoniopsis sp. IMI 355080]|nr:hypothetical protein N0V82_010629 [Gnomoniopsis sp. IMI 355080]
MAGADKIMEAIQTRARASASCLKETLIAETVDFTVQTSLQIFPPVKRENAWLFRPSDLETVRRREERFNFLMMYIALAFSKNNVRTFEGGQRLVESALKETDEALVAKFTKLMQVWKADKAGGSVGGAIVDNNNNTTTTNNNSSSSKARPSETLKSLSVPGPVASKPHNIAPRQSSHDFETTPLTSNRFKLSGHQRETQKMTDLAEVLAKAPIVQSTISHRPSSASPSKKLNHHPPQVPGDLLPVVVPPKKQQQPCESNAFGIETHDGVLVGHPPDYPPGLLDWESPEDDEEFEELVSNRRARGAAHAAATTESARTRRVNQAHNSETLEGHEPETEDDDGWVCL